MKVALIFAAVFLQGAMCQVVPETKTYGTYSMTHPATSAGVYSSGTTNTYNGGSTIYYPQGATITYPSACTVYYPTTTTCSSNGGSTWTTYNAGTYVNYPANYQVQYKAGSTCFYPRTTSCTYGNYNGATSTAIRYPASTPVSCYSPTQPTYYAPGTYNSGTTYYNYGSTGGTSYVNNSDGTRSAVTCVGYTTSNYPISYVQNQNTGATTCVTQTGSSSYITYNTATSSTSSGSTMYG
ncbi:probable ATP-dependent RNA helicase ddx17 [Folsomia candida]|uniref:Uncharacterized protein n=1 Tax=Folsomia candida TaxID=158441 RepID=A0A226DE62_FOLCA|nr:probable ATP-dependent RNA helicase ddx17 [Folsomia candida]OXA43459.1 hypothetical protein Fcan01_21793 [Folsomia candida]